MYYNRPNTAVGPPVDYDRSSTPNRGARIRGKNSNSSNKNNNNTANNSSRRVVSTFSPNSTFANYVQNRQASIAQHHNHLPTNPFNQFGSLLNSGFTSKSQPIVPKPVASSIPHKYGLYRNTSLQTQKTTSQVSKLKSGNNLGFRSIGSNSSFTASLPEIDISGQTTSLNIDLLTRKLNKLANQQQILEKVRHSQIRTSRTEINSSESNTNSVSRHFSRPASQADSIRNQSLEKEQLPPIKINPPQNIDNSKQVYPEEFVLEKSSTENLKSEFSQKTREFFIKNMITRVIKKASKSDYVEDCMDEDEDEPETDANFINRLRPKSTADTNRGLSPTTALSMYSNEQNPEIPIEVVDPDGSTKRFFCSFKLLIQGMPYFRKVFGRVDSRFHKKDVDISVQCDISVFRILLDYVKSGEEILKNDDSLEKTDHLSTPIEKSPSNDFKGDELILEKISIDHKTMIGLLIASDHLGMSSFFIIALEHFSKTLGNIVKKVSNLHHITDSIFVRLVNLKKDKVLETFENLPASKTQQRIFRLLTQDLVENEANGLFRCRNCGKLLLSKLKNSQLCSKHQINIMGEHVSNHQVDKEFNLNQHLKEVFNSSIYNKDWKKLYWYFWSMVTTLESTKCVRCGKAVQIISMNTCLSHSAKINFPTIHQNDKMFESRVGIYACCGQKETRFNVNVNNIQNGCSKTDHFFDRDFLTEKEQQVFDVFQEKRGDLVLIDVEVEKTDRMSLLEVDNHEFLQELANGRNSKIYSSDTETATTGCSGLTNGQLKTSVRVKTIDC